VARLPEGKQSVYPGVYYTMRPTNKGLTIEVVWTIKWYGYIFLAIKRFVNWFDRFIESKVGLLFGWFFLLLIILSLIITLSIPPGS
jgi:hypothetical protein